MTKTENKRGLVPKLRFPEFRDAGEWVVKRLGEVLKFQAGFPFDSASFTEECKGLRLIRNRDLKSDDKIIFYFNSFDENYVVNDGDVLIGMDGDFTPCVWNKGKALLNQRVGRIIPHKNVSQMFMYYFLTVHLKTIEEATARTTVKHLSHSDVEKICEPLPTFPEQQKIADCLTSLDDLIRLEAEKLEALKTHKKGLMQQLFPAEGETVPKLRFPEFRDADGWSDEKLEDLVTTVSPPVKLQTSSYMTQGRFPIIDQSQEAICGWTDDESTLVTESLPLIVFGDHTCALKFVEKPFAQGADGIKILKAKPIISAAYLFQSLNNNPLVMEDYKRHFSILKERVVCFPDAKTGEQKIIADCLSALDTQIATQAEKIEALKSHKKGLMQQLFPVLDEVQA